MNALRKPFKYRNDNVVLWLIGINVLVFLAQQLFQRDYLTVYLAMVPQLVLRGWVWQIFTYMFAHGSFQHIIFNMLGLFMFGTQVERTMGSREFLLYYLLTGFAAGLFSLVVYILSGLQTVMLLGASGAIFAVELSYAVLFPRAIVSLWGLIPLRAPVMVLGYTAIELVLSLTGYQSNVAHLTHLAGFGAGWLYFPIRFGVNPWKQITRRQD
jgi:membrane associated rhomboid family serine protease